MKNEQGNCCIENDNLESMDCSWAAQMVLDLKRCTSFDKKIYDEILQHLESHHDEQREASKMMMSHEYTEKSIVFDKKYKQLEYRHYITPQANAALDAMICIMRTTNLVRMSVRDIMQLSSIGNKNTVSKAISCLLENGCIAIVIEGSRNRSPVYMVNPLIAVCGRTKSKKRFWKFTGTKYTDSGVIKSAPHILWELHESKKTFSIGYDCQQTKEGMIYFNKVNEPCIKLH